MRHVDLEVFLHDIHHLIDFQKVLTMSILVTIPRDNFCHSFILQGPVAQRADNGIQWIKKLIAIQWISVNKQCTALSTEERFIQC